MAKRKKKNEINNVLSEGEIKEMQRYEYITNELKEIENTGLSANSLLVKLNNLYVEEATTLLYIHRNLSTINLSKEISNSAETLINKLVEIASEIHHDDSENYNEKFVYNNVTNELMNINDKAHSELDEVDKDILGMAEKSLWSIVHELAMMNIHVENYEKTNTTIKNFCLKEYLIDNLTNPNYTEEEHEIFKSILENINVQENGPKLVRKKDDNE